MSKNSRLLASFTEYCREHPELRFWQALRDWSKFTFIYSAETSVDNPALIDTFYLEDNL